MNDNNFDSVLNRSITKSKEMLQRNTSEQLRVRKRGNFILRQELKNLTPEFSLKCSIICNVSMSIIFFIFAIPILTSAKNSIEYSVDYTNW
jgi:hypothetical protein